MNFPFHETETPQQRRAGLAWAKPWSSHGLLLHFTEFAQAQAQAQAALVPPARIGLSARQFG